MFVKHQNFTECKLQLTPSIRESDLARENRPKINNNLDSGGGVGEPPAGGDAGEPGGDGQGQHTASGHTRVFHRNDKMTK